MARQTKQAQAEPKPENYVGNFGNDGYAPLSSQNYRMGEIGNTGITWNMVPSVAPQRKLIDNRKWYVRLWQDHYWIRFACGFIIGWWIGNYIFRHAERSIARHTIKGMWT